MVYGYDVFEAPATPTVTVNECGQFDVTESTPDTIAYDMPASYDTTAYHVGE